MQRYGTAPGQEAEARDLPHLYEQAKECAPLLGQQVGAQLRGVMLNIRQQDVCSRDYARVLWGGQAGWQGSEGEVCPTEGMSNNAQDPNAPP